MGREEKSGQQRDHIISGSATINTLHLVDRAIPIYIAPLAIVKDFSDRDGWRAKRLGRRRYGAGKPAAVKTDGPIAPGISARWDQAAAQLIVRVVSP
jgi:hypothetical protein